MNEEIKISGKKVVLRQSFPAGEFHDLPRAWAGADELDFTERVSVFARFIESWEFDGDPHDPASWQKLDAFREVAPIERHINQFAIGLLSDAKN